MALTLTAPTHAQDPPNILLVLIDDAGIENFSVYNLRGGQGDPPYAATSVFIDPVATNGLLFLNAWSNPLCSPTRGAIHTGEFASRTGIGNVIDDDGTKGLDVFEADLLPRLLASSAEGTAYATAMFGKWHLGTSVDQANRNAPRAAGYTDFFATFLDEQEAPADLEAPFVDFWETRSHEPAPATQHQRFDAHLGLDLDTNDPSIYLTHHMTTRAIDWIKDQEGPWFAYLPYAAAHEPWACPLTEEEGAPYEGLNFECDSEVEDNDEEFRSMIRTIDLELARLAAETELDYADTLVIIASDNGTPANLENNPFNGNLVKGTVGQGGVRVPLLIRGAGVTDSGPVQAAVSLTDLYATILTAADKDGLIPGDSDSVSLTPYFSNNTAGRVHDFTYTEIFFPNFEPDSGFGPCRGFQAAQEDPDLHTGSAVFKYARNFDGTQEALFDINQDPFEGNNLIQSPPSQGRLDALRDYIDEEIGGELKSICATPQKGETGDPCDSDDDCCSNMCNTTVQECVCPM